MKILITTEFYLPKLTGVVTAVINQKNALELEGHDVRILTIGDVPDSFYDEKEKVYYIEKIKWQPYPDSYVSFDYNNPLIKDIIEWHPDIVHANCEFFTMSFAKKIARKCKAPLLDTCHTDFDQYYMHFMSWKGLWNLIIPPVLRSRLKYCRHVVCPTEKIQDMLISYKVKIPMSVIPVGLDLRMFRQKLDNEERVSILNRLHIPSDAFVFVSVCRVSPEKNIIETINNFIGLRKQFEKPSYLLIVGDGQSLEELKNYVSLKSMERYIIFTGAIYPDEVWKYYKLGNVFVSASQSEIQGLTYIEALASGVPLLCRADQSLDGTLQYGENGFSYETENDFIEKALNLMENKQLYNKMKDNSSESVTKYGLSSFSRSLISLYNILIVEKGRVGESDASRSNLH